jgi:thiamine pyrophosphate-dependent acetolactate synthase large subunit-like protein
LTRDEVISAVLEIAGRRDAVVFAGNGYNARAVAALAADERVFPMVGSMSLCPTLAAGFAHDHDTPVIVVEGDGNALMGLSGLPVVARAAGAHFVHVVVDNGECETTGGQRTLSAYVDFGLLALAAGYRRIYRPSDRAAFEVAVDAGLDEETPVFVAVSVPPRQDPLHPRVPSHPREIAARFRDVTREPR